MKIMKKKKRIKNICLILGVLLVIIAICGSLFEQFYLKEANKLEEELTLLTNEIEKENISYQRIYHYTDRTITNGTMKQIELSTKNYIRDLTKEVELLENIIQEQKWKNLLTKENIASDGPLFLNSQDYIKQKRDNLSQRKKNILKLLTKEGFLSYYEKEKGLLYNIYLKEIEKEVEDTFMTENESIEESLQLLDEYFILLSNTMSFLTENKNNWQLEDDYIYFSEDELAQKYENFLHMQENLAIEITEETI